MPRPTVPICAKPLFAFVDRSIAKKSSPVELSDHVKLTESMVAGLAFKLLGAGTSPIVVADAMFEKGEFTPSTLAKTL